LNRGLLKAVGIYFLVVSFALAASPVFSGPLSTKIVYLTDLEGSRQRWQNFLESSPGFYRGADGKFHLRPEFHFVYGGDAPDRFLGSLKVVSELVRLKKESPERVSLIAGNRDINKLRIAYEFSEEGSTAPVGLFPWIHKNVAEVRFADPSEKLRWVLAKTMGAPNAFELRRAELKALKHDSSDRAVLESYRFETSADGIFAEYLSLCDLAKVMDGSLFVHGGITRENLGLVPGMTDRFSNLTEWVDALNSWYHQQIDSWRSGSSKWKRGSPFPAQDLILYQMPVEGTFRNRASVVYGRNVDKNNVAELPASEVIDFLLKQGIHRLVIGHTPQGSIPILLRNSTDTFEVISADISYVLDEAKVVHVELEGLRTKTRGRIQVSSGSWIEVKNDTELFKPSPLGKLAKDGFLLVGQSPEAWVGFQMLSHVVAYRLMPTEDCSQLLEKVHSSAQGLVVPEGR